jgi:subtilisin family serine protease
MKRIKQAACTFSFLAIAACGDMEGQDVQVDEPRQEISQVSQLLRAKHPIPGQYIVVLKEDLKTVALAGPESIGQEMALKHGGQVLHSYKAALKGFAIRMPEARVQQLLADPRVAYVEEDQMAYAIAVQSPATWGIDRTDQRALPLSNSYDNKDVTASSVHSYVIDTGVKLTHQEFAGRMGNGYDAVTSGGSANDCNGHGTHVAGTMGGTTYGLAKQTIIHPVRVLDCNGSGTNSGVIAGMDWVANNHVKPAVANMSLGGGASQAVDDAVQRMFAAGVVVAVAAGNDNRDACGYSPARAPNAITVGSTANNDARSSFSNFGTCLDIFAPGSSITSAWHTNDTSTNTISGTSMASPHVAGVAALYLSANPTATPQQVRDALVANGTANVVTSPGTGSPNVLLYSAFIGGGGGGGDTTAPTTSITSPAGGATVSGTTTISANASDNVGVSRVEFYLGGTMLGSDSTSPYSYDWNTTTVANGTYSLTTRAVDAAGNVGSSAAVSVNVSNGGGGGNCSITEQLLSNPGFESGNVTWTADTGVISASTNARTGSYLAWMNGYGNANTDFVYQTITIPSGACSATLKFWTKITTSETTTTSAYDKLTITVRNTSNSVLATLATYSNLNKSSSYVERSFDLGAYKGQTIRVYFHGQEDAIYSTSFMIDDTSLTITR